MSSAASEGVSAPGLTEAADAAAPAGLGSALDGEEPPGGLPETARAAWGDLRGAVSERVRLALLELRLAGLTLVQLVIFAVIVAVLVVTAWLGLMGGVVISFISIVGLHWSVALGIGIVSNLLVAFLLVRAMYKMVERVGLPASLRTIEGKPPAD